MGYPSSSYGGYLDNWLRPDGYVFDCKSYFRRFQAELLSLCSDWTFSFKYNSTYWFPLCKHPTETILFFFKEKNHKKTIGKNIRKKVSLTLTSIGIHFSAFQGFFLPPVNWKLGSYVLCSFLALCVEQTSSTHQTSNICCLHNTFCSVATLSELNSSPKFGILQIVLLGISIWQQSLVSIIETLLSDKEHQDPFARFEGVTRQEISSSLASAHNLKRLSLLVCSGLLKIAVLKAFLYVFFPIIAEVCSVVFLCHGYLKGPGSGFQVPLTWALICSQKII